MIRYIEMHYRYRLTGDLYCRLYATHTGRALRLADGRKVGASVCDVSCDGIARRQQIDSGRTPHVGAGAVGAGAVGAGAVKAGAGDDRLAARSDQPTLQTVSPGCAPAACWSERPWRANRCRHRASWVSSVRRNRPTGRWRSIDSHDMARKIVSWHKLASTVSRVRMVSIRSCGRVCCNSVSRSSRAPLSAAMKRRRVALVMRAIIGRVSSLNRPGEPNCRARAAAGRPAAGGDMQA